MDVEIVALTADEFVDVLVLVRENRTEDLSVPEYGSVSPSTPFDAEVIRPFESTVIEASV